MTISHVSSPPLATTQVFDQMRNNICKIESQKGRTSGFFIGNGTLLATAFHCLTPKKGSNDQWQVFTDDLRVTFHERTFTVGFPRGFDGQKARKRDLCLLVPSEQPQTECFELLPKGFEIKEGMDVYFGGYPLRHDALTFHKGTISSVYHENGLQCFTVDGTIVPGNSGGPVIIQHEGKLYLAGVIFAEMADFVPEFAQVEARLAEAKASGKLPSMTVGPNNAFDLISVALTSLKQNLSTGIGKAIHVRHLLELTTNESSTVPLVGDPITRSPGDELPVIKKREVVACLTDNGWWKEREGGNHEVWTNGVLKESVGRHSEVPNGTARKIMKAAEENPAEEEAK